MTTEVIKLALEVLISAIETAKTDVTHYEAIDFDMCADALQKGNAALESLAKQKQGEPAIHDEIKTFQDWCFSVGLMAESYGILSVSSHVPIAEKAWKARGMLTTPQQRKPLTDEQKQITFMRWGLIPANQSWGIQDWFYAGIAYAEAAHDIKEAA